MIKCICIFCGTLFLFKFAFPQTPFEKVYGGQLPEVFQSAIETSDGNLLAGGSTQSFGNGNISNTDFYLVKTNGNGDTLWTRAFGTTNAEDGNAVAEIHDGYVIAGNGLNAANNTYDFYLVKTDT